MIQRQDAFVFEFILAFLLSCIVRYHEKACKLSKLWTKSSKIENWNSSAEGTKKQKKNEKTKSL